MPEYTGNDDPQDTDSGDSGNRAANRYKRYAEAGNLAEATDRDSLKRKARRKARNLLARSPDLDPDSLDIREYGGWEDFSEGNLGPAGGMLERWARSNAHTLKPGQDPNDFKPGQAMNHWKVGQEKRVQSAMKGALQNEIDPSLEAAQERMDEFAGQDAIGAGEEQAMRSDLVSQIRSAESTKMNRLGAALGLGNMTNSPAAAALASRAADDADRAIVSTMRDLGLQISELNRNQARKDTAMATQIATARFNLLNGNAGSIIDMRGDIASMIDALYSRDAALELERQAIKNEGDTSFMQDLGGLFQVGAGAVGAGAGVYQSLSKNSSAPTSGAPGAAPSSSSGLASAPSGTGGP